MKTWVRGVVAAGMTVGLLIVTGGTAHAQTDRLVVEVPTYGWWATVEFTAKKEKGIWHVHGTIDRDPTADGCAAIWVGNPHLGSISGGNEAKSARQCADGVKNFSFTTRQSAIEAFVDVPHKFDPYSRYVTFK
jgi:hypothetical protein